MTKWSSENFDEAWGEGWYINMKGRLARSIPESQFTTSEAVFEHVRSHAAEGSKLHQKAIAYVTFLRLKS